MPGDTQPWSALADLGPFFAVVVHDPGAAPAPPWRSMDALVRDDAALLRRVDQVRGALAASAGRRADAIALRVAGSVAHLGLVARVLSPPLGAAALHAVRIDSALAGLWWQPTIGGPFPLSVPGTTHHEPDQARLADLLVHDAVLGPVAALGHAIGGVCGVPSTVLWGNVASAVNAAAVQMTRIAPQCAERALDIARHLLSTAPLDAQPAAPGPGFRRRSCCLIYQAFGSAGSTDALCGDCVLRRPAAG